MNLLTTTTMLFMILCVCVVVFYGLNLKSSFYPLSYIGSLNNQYDILIQLVIGICSWFFLSSLLSLISSVKLFLFIINLLVMGGFGYVIYLLNLVLIGVKSVSYAVYSSYDQSMLLLIQSSFNCCGFNNGDVQTISYNNQNGTFIYKGQNFNINNPCINAQVSINSCYQNANEFYSRLWIYIISGYSVLSFFIILLLILITRTKK